MAHSDIDSKNPPRRRIGAVVLVQDNKGRVLLVKPTYKDGWQLPGGGAGQGESIAEAAARELLEETGLTLIPTHFLALDYMPANEATGAAEGFNVVCDGGTLSADVAATVAVPTKAAHELSACEWVFPGDLDGYAKPYQARRIRAALDAIGRANELPLLVQGEQAAA